MFAYCENGPVCKSDHCGFSWITDIIDGITGNDSSNNGENISQIIYDQTCSETKNIKYGTSTIGDSGCGVVALYNALLLSGMSTSFSSIKNYFENRNYLRRLGTWTGEITDYLFMQGISYEKGTNASIIEKTKNGGVAIVTFWNEMSQVSLVNPMAPYSAPIHTSAPNLFSGAHTVAITYSDGQYWVYNAYNNPNNPKTCAFGFPDYEDYIKGGFISGCYIP